MGVAVCSRAEPRPEGLRIGDQDEHDLVQPIEVVTSVRHAVDTRAPWAGCAPNRSDLIRRSLLLVQVIEAVAKSLEVYPVEVLESGQVSGRRYAGVSQILLVN
jgi:hypothetical protein